MAEHRRKNTENRFDERPLEEVWENLYGNPLECDERVYCSKNKEKPQFSEKNEDIDEIFGQNRD